MNTRKINQLPVLQQATEETNVLVEQNGTAGRIPVGALGGSSDALIEKLAPAFTKTAPVVTCNPVEGYPLEVVTHLMPGRSRNLIENYNKELDDDDNLSIMLELPAGKYALWYAGEQTVYVFANRESSELAHIESTEGEPSEKEIEFMHPGGMLRIVDWSWTAVFTKDTLTLRQIVDTANFATLNYNNKVITMDFPVSVTNGTFNWSAGVLSVMQDNPNRIPVDLAVESNWTYDENIGFYSYAMELPGGTYIVYADECLNLDVRFNGDPEMVTIKSGEPATFTHTGGTVVLEEWNDKYGAVTIQLAEVLVDTYQLVPHEIIGLSGVNTFKSVPGDTTVSGKADLTAALAEQETRIAALEAALLNG